MILKITPMNRFYRYLWQFVYCFFVRSTPNIMFAWRRLIYIAFGASIGKGCRIYPKAKVWNPSKLIMHDRSCVADDCIIYNVENIEIGERSVVSQGARIITATKSMNADRLLIAKSVVIGDDCWIAMEAFLSPGVRIGNRSVILARVIINEDIPDDSVVKLTKGYIVEPKR